MLKTFYIPYSGDLYEITCDFLGDIHLITVYRDNRNSIGEPLDKDSLPHEVVERLSIKTTKMWKNL